MVVLPINSTEFFQDDFHACRISNDQTLSNVVITLGGAAEGMPTAVSMTALAVRDPSPSLGACAFNAGAFRSVRGGGRSVGHARPSSAERAAARCSTACVRTHRGGRRLACARFAHGV